MTPFVTMVSCIVVMVTCCLACPCLSALALSHALTSSVNVFAKITELALKRRCIITISSYAMILLYSNGLALMLFRGLLIKASFSTLEMSWKFLGLFLILLPALKTS